MKNILFSVIIPAYNAEEYVERCILSVINQTYKNIEIIVVNDGSTDNTKHIVNTIINEYTSYKINLINIPNGGLANARNVGLELATGDYMCNLDSDDFLDSNIFEDIANLNKPFDICFYGWKDIDENTQKVIGEYNLNFLEYSISGPEAALRKLKRQIWICQGNAVYNLKMIKDNKIWNVKGLNQGEDWYFITRALIKAKEVVSIPKNSFNCTLRNTSMMHSNFNTSHLQFYVILQRLFEDVTKYDLNADVKSQLLRYIEKEILFSRINIAKKISDSYSLTSMCKAIELMDLYCELPDVSWNTVKNISSLREVVQYKLYSFSKYIYFLFTKFYRLIYS